MIQMFKHRDSPKTTVAMDVDLSATFLTVAIMDRLADDLANKAVEEIWKVHGASIIRKVDKKTIGNLTVKKLSALIAKELAPTKTQNEKIY